MTECYEGWCGARWTIVTRLGVLQRRVDVLEPPSLGVSRAEVVCIPVPSLSPASFVREDSMWVKRTRDGEWGKGQGRLGKGRSLGTDGRRMGKIAESVEVACVEFHEMKDDEHMTGFGVAPMAPQVQPLTLESGNK